MVFKVAYWISCDSNIEIFSIAPPLVIALNPFASFFVYVLEIGSWLLFLYCFPYSYRSTNYCDSNSCRSFTLLKALAKSKSTQIAIAFKSEKEQYFYLYSSLLLLRASKSNNFAIAKFEER